jgi:hypothetical protein
LQKTYRVILRVLLINFPITICFKVSQIDIFGAKSGSYSRNDKLTAEDFEMLVIAKK